MEGSILRVLMRKRVNVNNQKCNVNDAMSIIACFQIHQSGSGWSPVYVEDNLSLMSAGFLLPSLDAAVIWRGPKKNGLIKQLLRDVDWAPSGNIKDTCYSPVTCKVL